MSDMPAGFFNTALEAPDIALPWNVLTSCSFLFNTVELLYQVRQFRYFEVGRISVVGMVTGYGLDGLGIESRWRRDFPHPSRLVLLPKASYTMGTGSFSGVKRPGRGGDFPRPSSAEVK
jgi:hypothetical protein